ncbi:hypothetical protein AB8880_09315 [Alphaproteobacteria bacterium LSUCC0684]
MGIQSFWTDDARYVTLDPMRATEGMKIRPEHSWLSQIDELPATIVISLLDSINQSDALRKMKVASDGKSKASN